MKRHLVLVVAQDVGLRALVARSLRAAGYAVELAESARRAGEVLAASRIDAAIIVPDGIGPAGATLIERARDLLGPGLVCCAPDQARDAPALRSRVAEALAGSSDPADGAAAPLRLLGFAGHTVDRDSRALFDENGREVPLTRSEFALLATFLDHPGRALSRERLRNAVAGEDLESYERSIDMLVSRLRRKIEPDPKKPSLILTVPGIGYKFAAAVARLERPSPAAAAPSAGPESISRPAERRLVTVLDCRIVGAAMLASARDPEEVQAALGAVHQIAARIIEHHGGTVLRRSGDGVAACFGYPAAGEDDAECAVRAGLRLAAAVAAACPAELELRLGIASGPAVVGALLDGTGALGAIGEVPDRAERLAAMAPPNGIVIGANARRLAGRGFAYRAAGTLRSEGGEPVPAWRVVAETPFAGRFAARHVPGIDEFVGRGEELALLLRRWRQACHGAGQVVLIAGEPGIGKSRLAGVVGERLRAERHVRLRCFGSPYHRNTELFPLIGHLERAARLARGDSAEEKLAKLAAFAAEAGCGAGEELQLLASLMSLPADEAVLGRLGPRQKRERTLALLQAMVERLAAERPVFLLCEDAQWFDPTSRDLLARTVERAPQLPLLLLVTARPDFAPSWADHSQVTVLRLARLPQSDAAALVRQTAADRPLPEDRIAEIVTRGGGVPLFLEELTRAALMGDQAGSHGIPLTLEGLLLSRLDRLGPAREIAQIGAAIGQTFSHELLAMVAGGEGFEERLDRLVGSELVYRQGAPPDAVYRFKHALVRDVAYASLSRRRRRELHAHIALALEEKFPEVVEAEPELLAYHNAEAGLIEKSAAYWGRAGRRSAARSAMAEAVAQLRQGLDQVARLPDTPERQRQELELRSALGAALRTVKGQAAPETGDAYARARELWEQLGAPSEFLGVPYGLARYYAFRGEYELARRLGEDLLHLSRQRSDHAGLVLGGDTAGRNLMLAGMFAPSRAHLEEALSLYDPISDSSLVDQFGIHPHIATQAFLAMSLLCLGFLDQASAQCNAAIAEARRLAHPPSLAVGLAIGVRFLLLVGDNAALDERTGELLRMAAEQNFPFYHAMGTIFRGWVAIGNGDAAEGISLLHCGSITFRATGSEIWRPHHTALLAGACEIAGQIDDAVHLVNEALQAAERTGESWFAAELNRHKGQLLLRQGHAAAAEELYRKALGVAREQEAKLWELRAAVSLARLRCDQGRRDEARDLLAPVYDWFTEGFAMPDLKEAKALLDELA